MKIDEAVKMINTGTATVKAHHSGSNIFVHSTNDFIGHDWFLMVGDKAMTWENVAFDSDCLEGVIPQDLARVMDAVQRLLDTPVKDRFPEKKYRLVANPNSLEETGTYASKYVAVIQDTSDSFSFMYGEPTVFSEKALKQIEGMHPTIAPAIEAMKEPVEEE